MFIRVPVSRRPLHRLFDLSPGLEASSFERQRLEGFPPGFNQVQVGIVNLFIGAKHIVEVEGRKMLGIMRC
jgi:hypothetical protein